MKYFADHFGNYLGGYDENNIYMPRGAVEVTTLPPNGVDYVYKDGQWITRIQHLNNYLANIRWLKETKGILLNGLPVPTDDRSKLMLQGAYTKALIENDLTLVHKFKLPNGMFIELTNQNIIDMAIAVAFHVQKCFDIESGIAPLINNGTLVTEEEVQLEYETQFNAV